MDTLLSVMNQGRTTTSRRLRLSESGPESAVLRASAADAQDGMANKRLLVIDSSEASRAQLEALRSDMALFLSAFVAAGGTSSDQAEVGHANLHACT